MISSSVGIAKAVSAMLSFAAYVYFLLTMRDMEALKVSIPYVSGLLFCALVAIAVIADTDSKEKKPKISVSLRGKDSDDEEES